MKDMFAVVAILMAVGLCGCESSDGGSEYRTLPAEPGVTPALGEYVMIGDIYYDGAYIFQKVFHVVATNAISYSSDTFSAYNIPIHDGGVSFSNGNYCWTLPTGENVVMEDYVNCAPTDGFALQGKFTSPTHFEGLGCFGTTNLVPISANRR
ncbi:MAG: hypothetical protein WCW14_00295 [Candidatus Paceibacterota bacterium]|jgi:hypothetical protein